ncbi:MAG: protein adenylyltransferase SelO family protein, partial [Gammaproteobacteria bacterium]
QIALWNLVQLANALYPLIEDIPELERALGSYSATYEAAHATHTAAKLGLSALQGDADRTLVEDLFKLLAAVETDMTIFFRQLALLDAGQTLSTSVLPKTLAEAYYVPEQVTPDYLAQLHAWLASYLQRAASDPLSAEARRKRMNSANPRYVLRNYLAQLAIDRAEEGDYAGVTELLEVLRRPYDDQTGAEHLAARRPDWARQRAGCSMLSCSS